MPKLSVVIIVRNEEHNILRCLESVKTVADEIVVIDGMSTDNTAGICKANGCAVYQREFDGYGTQKQFAVDKASHDWVFSIDADEVVSEELKIELAGMFGSLENKVTGSAGEGTGKAMPEGFNIPFSLFFMGKLLRYGGVGKEIHLRLFNRNRGGFTRVPVHEGIEVMGPVVQLNGRIIHYSYRDISHHLGKINTYTSQAAEGYGKQGRSFSKIWVAFKFPTSFFSFYIIKRGFLDGYPGFMWSFLAAVYATLKVAKTIELNRRL
jgi:glycosyltransferase involved in cell wall biosynthesis